MTLYDLVEYLVKQRLAGNKKSMCIYSMIVEGKPPKEISEVCDITKSGVKSYVSRVIEKMGNGHRAVIALKHILPLVLKIEPIIVGGRCRICGAEAFHPIEALNHVQYRHRDTIEHYTKQIISTLKLVNSG
jgi:DNA-binding CsgD family transcriptional regulator